MIHELLRRRGYEYCMREPNKNAPHHEIAARLIAAQDALGLSAKEMAERAGLTKSQMSNWQSGQVRISLEGAIALRETHGLSLDFIFFGNLDALPYKLARALQSSPLVSNSQ